MVEIARYVDPTTRACPNLGPLEREHHAVVGHLYSVYDRVLLGDHGEPVLFEERSCCDARVGVELRCARPDCDVVEMRQKGAGDTPSTEPGSDKHHVDVTVVSDV